MSEAATIKAVIRFCKKIFAPTDSQESHSASTDLPRVLDRAEHNISGKLISPSALKVLYRLNKAGFDAYLVGGGVRDLLLGLEPKDFDIATNATPEEIKALFRNCRLIGRRFRLAHIMFGREIIEVATFRGHHDATSEASKPCNKTSKQNEQGMLLRDNIYGSIDEDAERRDFTINALYYSAADFKVYDFADGLRDLNNNKIRLIGDPETRYREDPVRMLRAVRFATKLSMEISEETAAPIKSLASLLANIPAARMFEEYLKLFMSGKALENFKLLNQFGLAKHLFPHAVTLIEGDTHPEVESFIDQVLINTDKRINDGKRVTPAFLLAAMLWHSLQQKALRLNKEASLSHQDAFFAALNEVLSEQQQNIAIPKRFQSPMKDIWILQERLTRRDGRRAYKLMEHPKFRAAYDFLVIRGEVEGGHTLALASWWTDFQQAPANTQENMIKSLRSGSPNARRLKRKRRKPHKKQANQTES
jgi:poly(A) polymerase